MSIQCYLHHTSCEIKLSVTGITDTYISYTFATFSKLITLVNAVDDKANVFIFDEIVNIDLT